MLAEVVPLDEGDLRARPDPLMFSGDVRQPASEKMTRSRAAFSPHPGKPTIVQKQEPTVENAIRTTQNFFKGAPELENHANAGLESVPGERFRTGRPLPPRLRSGESPGPPPTPTSAPRSQCTIRASPPLYIEPGSAMLRAPNGSKQVYGRVVLDLQRQIWAFPTSPKTPTRSMRSKHATDFPSVPARQVLPRRTPITNRNVGGKGCKLVSHCDIGRMGGGASRSGRSLPGGARPSIRISSVNLHARTQNLIELQVADKEIHRLKEEVAALPSLPIGKWQPPQAS